mmetsp:Transcript_24926/g.57657  ORF Transcript_24926/g.57657 Transcript_24926/m.57657 type:complete len:167 (-) Transcript_24926:543-1043(-)
MVAEGHVSITRVTHTAPALYTSIHSRRSTALRNNWAERVHGEHGLADGSEHGLAAELRVCLVHRHRLARAKYGMAIALVSRKIVPFRVVFVAAGEGALKAYALVRRPFMLVEVATVGVAFVAAGLGAHAHLATVGRALVQCEVASRGVHIAAVGVGTDNAHSEMYR